MDFVEVQSRSITFEPTASLPVVRRECINIVIHDDMIYESTESFMLNLTLLMGIDTVVAPNVAEIFILDDGKKHFKLPRYLVAFNHTHAELILGFISPQYQANERDAFARVEFGILNGGITETDISVELYLTALSKFLVKPIYC